MCLRRRTVDLVGQYHVGKHRPLDKSKGLLSRREIILDHLRARDITGHEIRRELHAGERKVQRLSKCADQQRLGQPRNTYQQAVSARKERYKELVDNIVLTDDDLGDLAFDGCDVLRERSNKGGI